MSPPRCVDEHSRPYPTRPCPRCQRVIPVNRWPVQTLATTRRWPYQGMVITFVEWCGHQQEVVLVPRGRPVVLGDPGAGGGELLDARDGSGDSGSRVEIGGNRGAGRVGGAVLTE